MLQSDSGNDSQHPGGASLNAMETLRYGLPHLTGVVRGGFRMAPGSDPAAVSVGLDAAASLHPALAESVARVSAPIYVSWRRRSDP